MGTDQSNALGHSLKIVKSATSDSASWISDNMVDYWSQRHYANVDIKIGASIKTSGVNTAPVTDDQRWWVSYSFFDSAGVFDRRDEDACGPVGGNEGLVRGYQRCWCDGASEGFVEDDHQTCWWKERHRTLWADNFVLYGRAGAWAGQDWDAGVARADGMDVLAAGRTEETTDWVTNGFENTRIRQKPHTRVCHP